MPVNRGFVFNHIPKTGGVSLYRVIERLIGPGLLSPHFILHEDIEYHVSASDYEKYLVIYGHIGVVWNEILGPQRKWMTILRDPVDRVVSQYYYWRNTIPPSPHLPHVHAAQTLSLKAFARCRDFMVMQGNSNLQTWFLADDFRRRFRQVREDEALEVAKQHLSERFAYVGIFEEYNRSVRRLCEVLEKPYPDVIPHENVTPGRRQMRDIDPEITEAIREINTMDLQLYEFAKRITACPDPLVTCA